MKLGQVITEIPLPVAVKLLHPQALLPKYATAGSAAVDLQAWFPDRDSRIMSSLQRLMVPTGLAVEVPEGWCMKIYPRSGLALKQGITLANCVAVIDSDYRGEVFVPLVHLGYGDFTVKNGDRIAQAILEPVQRIAYFEEQELSSTERGAGGFGSTGV